MSKTKKHVCLYCKQPMPVPNMKSGINDKIRVVRTRRSVYMPDTTMAYFHINCWSAVELRLQSENFHKPVGIYGKGNKVQTIS